MKLRWIVSFFCDQIFP